MGPEMRTLDVTECAGSTCAVDHPLTEKVAYCRACGLLVPTYTDYRVIRLSQHMRPVYARHGDEAPSEFPSASR